MKEKREDKHGNKLFRKLRGQNAEPLTYTTKKENIGGEERITYITDPLEVDKEIRRRWSKEVYDGNGQKPEDIIKDFMEKYSRYIVKCDN